MKINFSFKFYVYVNIPNVYIPLIPMKLYNLHKIFSIQYTTIYIAEEFAQKSKHKNRLPGRSLCD